VVVSASKQPMAAFTPPPTFTLGSKAFFEDFARACRCAKPPPCEIDDLDEIFDFVKSTGPTHARLEPTRRFEPTRFERLDAAPTHPPGFLTRSSWLETLVRIAVRKCSKCSGSGRGAVKRGGARTMDVAIACESLFRDVLMRHLPAEALDISSSNHFRKDHCYVESTSECLHKHMPACRMWYAQYSRGVRRERDEHRRLACLRT